MRSEILAHLLGCHQEFLLNGFGRRGEILTHEHRTFHFQGTEADLDKLARKCLGVSLDKIKSALK